MERIGRIADRTIRDDLRHQRTENVGVSPKASLTEMQKYLAGFPLRSRVALLFTTVARAVWSTPSQENARRAENRSPLFLEPFRRIDSKRTPVGPMANLEVEVWSELRIGDTDSADLLSFRHCLLIAHVGVVQ